MLFQNTEHFASYLDDYLSKGTVIRELMDSIEENLKSLKIFQNDNYIILEEDEGVLSIYYNEAVVDILKVVDVNIFEGVVTGFRLDETIGKMYRFSMVGKRELMVNTKKEIEGKLSTKRRFKWLLDQRDTPNLENALQASKDAIFLIDKYDGFMRDRNDIVELITSEVHDSLNGSELFPFLRFSKTFENLEVETQEGTL